MKPSKKAMVADQVNWIYVMIAGGVILLLFAGIAVRQKLAADKSYAQDSLKVVDAVMFAPSGSSQQIKFPKLDMTVRCNTELELRIGQATPLKPFEPVFAAEIVKGNYLFSLSKEWDVPYKAANFVYLVSNEIRFVIIYDAQYKVAAERIFSILPDGMSKAKVEKVGSIPESAKSTVYLVFEPSASPYSRNLKPSKVISVSGDKITFIETTDKSVPYYGDAMILAALYSQDSKRFDCGMKQALQRQAHVQAVYESKIASLKDSKKLDPNCNTKYFGIVLNLAPDFSNVKGIAKSNENLLKNACPTIY